MMDGKQVSPVTEAEEKQIRDKYDSVLLTSSNATTGSVLHIPHPDNPEIPYCDDRTTLKAKESEWREKSPKCYPPGFKSICQYCGSKWRDA